MNSGPLARYSGQSAFAAVAIALLSAAAALGWIGWRAYGMAADQAEKYQSYRALQQGAGRADSLSAAYGNVLRDIQGIRESLPPQKEGSYALNLLVEEAGKSHLAIAGINAWDEVAFPGYRELPFEINLVGGFADLIGYLHSLETRGMVLEVRKLSAHAEALNKARITAKLELSILVPGGASAARAQAESPAP